jgi:hypothetical protein
MPSSAVPAKSHAGRKTLLTPEVQKRIVAAVRAGGYDWVAAEAAGIGRATFYRWVQQGEEDETASRDTRFREFRDEVRRAHAESRLGAEVEIKRENPESWLRNGPGRSRPDAPGWTNNADGSVVQAQTTVVNVLMSTNWQDVQARVLAALVKHPDARADVLQALAPLLEAQTPQADADIAEAHDDDSSNRD